VQRLPQKGQSASALPGGPKEGPHIATVVCGINKEKGKGPVPKIFTLPGGSVLKTAIETGIIKNSRNKKFAGRACIKV
jgi:hypothetical protein